MPIKQAKPGTSLLYAMTAQARSYDDAVILGRGDPDLDTPSHIVAAAGEAMQHHANDYSPPEGILAPGHLERVKKYNNIDADPETEIVVTNGGQEALFLMTLATVGPGEALLMPEPNYNTYGDVLRFSGGTRINVPTSPDTNFRVDIDAMDRAVTDNTSALLMVSPNNPCVSVIPPEDVRALVDLADKHDLAILSDEIYDRFVYDDYEVLSPASLPLGKERTLTLNAMSKAYAMTGWRVGWLTGPAPLMAQVKQLKAAISGPNSIVAQHAGLAALTGPQDVVDEMRATYIRRRKIVMDALDSMDIPYGIPQGGQFIFADISYTGMNSLELAQRILDEQHVLTFPGAALGPSWEHCLRITFLQPEEQLQEGMSRMKRTVQDILAAKREGMR